VDVDAWLLVQVSSGWDEFIARQALLSQWILDNRKSSGKYEPVPADVLASIKPTLKKQNTTNDNPRLDPGSASKSKAKTSTSSGRSAKPLQQQPPVPAKKEDCVFEVTASNFQKIVLESPVPVLLDVYADWCGPCKQLGPILEDAAVKSGSHHCLN